MEPLRAARLAVSIAGLMAGLQASPAAAQGDIFGGTAGSAAGGAGALGGAISGALGNAAGQVSGSPSASPGQSSTTASGETYRPHGNAGPHHRVYDFTTSTSSVQETLAQARSGFQTHLIAHIKSNEALKMPPPGDMNLVFYKAPLGNNPAYVSVPPAAGKRYPAIIWLVGGFDGSIDENDWTPCSPDNDQSAMLFRKDGIVTMYPSLRGGNNNYGFHESFYGEVDDVLAAEHYLAAQPFVDPHRIYLGGHSTGGTLALLVAESTGAFRGVFSLGPVASVADYGASQVTFDTTNRKEVKLRSPILFLNAITSPTYIAEGTVAPSNIRSLYKLEAANTNPRVHFLEAQGKDHYSEISYFTPFFCSWILSDNGPKFLGPDGIK